MDLPGSPSIINPEIDEIKQRLKFDRRYRGSVDWFFWISGLSVVNTIAFFLGWDSSFVVGLGVTQLIDAFASEISKELGSGSGVILVIGFLLDLFFTGIFVTCGILGRKFKRWAIITGMILYALDAVLVFSFKIYIAGIFHIIALIGLSVSLKAYSDHVKFIRLSRELAGKQSVMNTTEYRPPQ